MKRTHTYEAADGTTFETAAECKLYEKEESLIVVLSDLSQEQVAAALNRADLDLADAIERAGNIIAAKRRAGGELKRGKKKTDAFEGVVKAMEESK